jgi:type 2 lantibiotic biosynthesis protein LanM
VNARGFDPPLRTVNIFARNDEYGWVEWVERKPCLSEQDLADYHARCGALLALVTFIRGADCHFENIVANGAQPVLVDHEVVLAPESDEEASEDWAAIHQRLIASVISTGLLPQWSVEVDGTVIDLSGIGARRAARVKQRLVLANLNSDDMVLETTTDVPMIPGAEPDLAEEELLAKNENRRSDFEEHHVVGAYERIARIVLDLPVDERLKLFAGFDGLVTRHVLRSTLGYAHLLRESRKPELMTDGLLRTIALDRIARMLVAGTDSGPPPASWSVVRAEHESIAQGDVPTFFLRTNELGLFDANRAEIARDVFRTTGLDAMKRALRSWNRDEMAIELRLIRCSFSGKAAGLNRSTSASSSNAAPIEVPEEPFDDARAIDEALTIAREIAANAVAFRGQRYHLGLERDESSTVHQVALLGPNLYAGTSGIALFLAAAARVGKDEALRIAALEAMGPVRAELRRDPKAFVSSRIGKLGAFEGVGGLIYTFARLFHLTDGTIPSLIDDANLLTTAITERHLEENAAAGLNDVFSGTAGLLLAQIAFDRLAPQKDNITAKLVSAGARVLLRNAKREAKGIGWPLREGGRSICGFAHGNAGIAVALVEALRFVEASGAERDELRNAAIGALAYERSLRDDQRKNWPDLRDIDADQDAKDAPFMATWCNGAPGIALGRSRLAQHADLDLPDVQADLALAIENTKTASRDLPMGHLCCGTTGVEEILFEVGVRNNDAAQIEIARRRMMSLRRNSASSSPTQSPLVMENLMRGTAGVGLTLLRMSRAGRDLACVLDLSA